MQSVKCIKVVHSTCDVINCPTVNDLARIKCHVFKPIKASYGLFGHHAEHKSTLSQMPDIWVVNFNVKDRKDPIQLLSKHLVTGFHPLHSDATAPSAASSQTSY